MARKRKKEDDLHPDNLAQQYDDLIEKEIKENFPDLVLEDGQAYLNNKRLPKANIEIKWTEDMIKELDKCSKDILHFAQNYFYIITLDDGKQKIKFYPAQKRVIKSLQDNRFVVTVASRQVGKCVAGNTMIKIRNKITKKEEDISIEDFYKRMENQSPEL